MGILSAHYLHPTQDLLVLACDMLQMSESLISHLVNTQVKDHSYEAYVFATDVYYEPLCGVYTSKGLQRIANKQQKGELLRSSMQYVLNTLVTYSIPIVEEEKIKFGNFNSPEDLR